MIENDRLLNLNINLEATKDFLKSVLSYNTIEYDDFVRIFNRYNLIERDTYENSNPFLNKEGGILFGAMNDSEVHRDIHVKVLLPSGANQIYQVKLPGYLAFTELLQILQTHIPEFQDRAYSSTKIYSGIPMSQMKIVSLLAITLRNYKLEQPLQVFINRSDVTITGDSTQYFALNYELITRASKFTEVFKDSKLIDEFETEDFMNILTNILYQNDGRLQYKWTYNTSKASTQAQDATIAMENAIYDYISRRDFVSRKQIQSYFEIAERTTNYYIERLLQQGKITKNSTSKYDPNVKYAIIKDNDRYR